jgi:hypothetical protein
MCVFSDQEFTPGSRLDLEVALPGGGDLVRCWAEVVWVVRLAPGAPAIFDVGLKFTDMNPPDLQRLAGVLASET